MRVWIVAAALFSTQVFQPFVAAAQSASLQVQKPADDSTLHPLPVVCYLDNTRRKASRLWGRAYASGSGALVEGRFLVTAAHNVKTYGAIGSRLVELRVTCGELNGRTAAREVVLAGRDLRSRVYVGEGRGFDNDYAVVDLGATPWASASTVVLDTTFNPSVGSEVYLSGYPGEPLESPTGRLYHTKGSILHVDAAFIWYGISTMTGNSGGPLWLREGDTYRLIGIHVTGDDSGGSARRFTRDVAALIEDAKRRRPATR